MDADLEQNGVVAINISVEYARLISTEIYSLFSVQNYCALVSLISKLSPDHYQDLTKKYNRIFAGPISALAAKIASSDSIKAAVGASRLSVTEISPYEHLNRPTLNKSTPDFFFRIVRQYKARDVGPPHYDSQTWELTDGTSAQSGTSTRQRRWKIWIPLDGCDLENSLQFVKGSHLEDIPVSIDRSHTTQTMLAIGAEGTPCISRAWVHSNNHRFKPVAYQSGTCNLFHDRLVHMAPINLTTPLRISAEFTIVDIS